MRIIFSDNLLALRKEKNLSQEELGSKLFVTRQSISKWESGEVTPDLNKIQTIADYFKVPVEELLFGKEIYDLKSDKKNYFSEDDDERPINNFWEFLERDYWIIIMIIGTLGIFFF
ncbi:helix-turn-helix transcriptional regulator [Leuconostoc gasicomitatum]|uniref:helix-turn-helix transcriptional regulator n=1 Tax=Leuconostoc gasicomitatum TaxID=115778 RepID=UPI001CC56573|nr:helix-turn-helix transcriptional regulator [Leuconostoc gasicomitatum]MBZ5951870.1 helix-turn-helix transcriptional regulator [Leuconostoc gasicomitatum]